MIPIRDDAPRYRRPYVTYFLVALNLLVYLFELKLRGLGQQQIFVDQMGVVPLREWALMHGGLPGMALACVPVFTSMFVHASWLHVISNMWWLWIFGDNVEDELGHFAYLVFYFATGALASVLHILVNHGSSVPSVGASGAIAGVMGAYFVLFPAARVLTWIIFLVWVPAWVILGYWFVVQFLAGAQTAITDSASIHGGIAFWAHIGGFIAGVMIIKLMPVRPMQSRARG